MNTKLLSTAIVLFSVLASVGSVYAKGQPNLHQREVSRCNQEARAAIKKLNTQFSTIDSNQNGSLDISETHAAQIATRCFRHLDRNRDGVLSTVELQRLS